MAEVVSLNAAEQVTPKLLAILARHDPASISDILLIEAERLVGEREAPSFQVVLFKKPSPRPVSAMNRTARFVVIGNTPDRDQAWQLSCHIARHLGIRALDLTPLDPADNADPAGGAA